MPKVIQLEGGEARMQTEVEGSRNNYVPKYHAEIYNLAQARES